MNRFSYLLFALIFFFSCRSEKIDPVSFPSGDQYFPLTEGAFVIYNVTISTRVPGGFDYQNYQLKERVGDSFQEGNQTFYRMERFFRPDESMPWKSAPDTVYLAYKTETMGVKSENNIPFVKLVFPVKEAKTWNGNALNTLESDQYQMINLNKPFKIQDKNFLNTVTVIQESDTTNLIQRKYRSEVYAQGIGLIYKRVEDLKLDFNTADTTNGYIYLQSLIDYGS